MSSLVSAWESIKGISPGGNDGQEFRCGLVGLGEIERRGESPCVERVAGTVSNRNYALLVLIASMVNSDR